jgi:hypothetical protein
MIARINFCAAPAGPIPIAQLPPDARKGVSVFVLASRGISLLLINLYSAAGVATC